MCFLWRPEEGVELLAGVLDSWKPPDLATENQFGSSERTAIALCCCLFLFLLRFVLF